MVSFRSKSLIIAAVAAIVASSALVQASAADKEDDANPYLWRPRIKSVAVFKNGLGFLLGEGDVELRDGWCMAEEIPPAAFGTLVIFSHNKDHVVDIVGSGPGEVVEFDGRDASKDTNTKRDRLEASMGLSVELTYKRDGDEHTSAGKLRSVGTEFVMLEGESDIVAVPLESIERMQLLDMPMRIHVSSDGNEPPARTKLGIGYLRKGITWIPEYSLKILDDDDAEIALRGTLVNEAEDLVGCDVNFVVGVPHFAHADYMAPVAVGQMIRTIAAATAPPQVMTQIANRAALVRHQSAESNVTTRRVEEDTGDVRRALGNLPQMEGPGAGDYTVYTKKTLTVRRGEKAIVTLFTRKVKYSHLYRWSPPSAMRHFLVVANSTDTAWTTGPCLTLEQGRPLSEDLLTYVPKGGTAEIPVSAAINIAAQKTEMETDRKLKAHSPSHNFYLDLVNLKGELMLKNFEKGAARIFVTVQVPGRPISADDDGTVGVDAAKLTLTERSGWVNWEISLEPGETKTLEYAYERYVPSR